MDISSMTTQLREFKFIEPTQTPLEKKRRNYVQGRFEQMDTRYRESLLEMAALGRDATDGLVSEEDDPVANNELMKVPISHGVILQRLSTLIDNPSKAVFRTESRYRKRVQVLEQVNIEDKRRGNYNANYQEFQAKAEKEGICVVRQGWHEELKTIKGKPVTIGEIFSSQEDVMLENFWWDPLANELRGQTGLVANDCILRTMVDIETLRRKYEGKKGFKNLEKVKPFIDKDFFTTKPYDSEWSMKTIKHDNPVNEAIMWEYFARNFWDEEVGEYVDVHLIFVNGVEVYKSKLPVPKIKGAPVLPFFKLVSIPTGGFGGLSIPAVIRHPELALQRMITLADAQAELAVNPIQFVSNNIADVLEDEDLFPGMRIGVQMQARAIGDEVYTLESKDITQGAQYIIDKMMELISIITGVDIRAFFESPKQKAVSTERKREIQEKLLRYSVIYNESHGFKDMEELRLYIMLANYPKKRFFYKEGENEEDGYEERFPMISVDGYEVAVAEGSEEATEEQKVFELRQNSKAFSFLTITPASIIEAHNVVLYIEGATLASNEDVFELNKKMDKISILVTNPWIQQIIDPIKAARQIFKAINLDENDWIKEELEISDNTKHGAQKEIDALLVSDIIQIDLQINDDYEANEYVQVFGAFVSTEGFPKLPVTVQQKILERQSFHITNSLNPYYKEEMIKQKQMAEQQAQQVDAQGNPVDPLQNAKVSPTPSNELEQRVDSKAGTLGKVGKTKTQKGNEQKR